jgi:hypothetical protein
LRVLPGEHRQILEHQRVEERREQILRRNALLLQAVDVGLREDAALAGDRVDLQAARREARERVGTHLQLRGNLVDHDAGAAGALVVHRHELPGASLVLLLEEDDLRVLSAELDDRAGVGVPPFDGQRQRRHFLDVAPADDLRGPGTRAPRHDGARVAPRHAGFRLEAREQFEQLLVGPALVPLVRAPDEFAGRRVGGRHLHRGRPDVDPEQESGIRVAHDVG